MFTLDAEAVTALRVRVARASDPHRSGPRVARGESAVMEACS